jgi:hypothetical protein
MLEVLELVLAYEYFDNERLDSHAMVTNDEFQNAFNMALNSPEPCQIVSNDEYEGQICNPRQQLH